MINSKAAERARKNFVFRAMRKREQHPFGGLRGAKQAELLDAFGARGQKLSILKADLKKGSDFEGIPIPRIRLENVKGRRRYVASRIGNWDYYFHRGLKNYAVHFGFQVNSLVEGLLANKPRVRIIDIGCGDAVVLRRLKKHFKERVFVAGVSLKRRPSHSKLDKVYIRDFESRQIGEKYDLVLLDNALMYFGDPVRAIERAFSMLAVGGKAAINLSSVLMSKVELQKTESFFLEDFLADWAKSVPANGAFSVSLTNKNTLLITKNRDCRMRIPLRLVGREYDFEYKTHYKQTKK